MLLPANSYDRIRSLFAAIIPHYDMHVYIHFNVVTLCVL